MPNSLCALADLDSTELYHLFPHHCEDAYACARSLGQERVNLAAEIERQQASKQKVVGVQEILSLLSLTGGIAAAVVFFDPTLLVDDVVASVLTGGGGIGAAIGIGRTLKKNSAISGVVSYKKSDLKKAKKRFSNITSYISEYC